MGYILNGESIQGQFTIGEINYPARWCESQSLEDLVELGITWEEPQPQPNPIPYVPQQVTMRQARLALFHAGILDGIDAAVATMSKPAQIEWEYAAVVDRSNVLLSQIGLTTEQLDDLFLAASKL